MSDHSTSSPTSVSSDTVTVQPSSPTVTAGSPSAKTERDWWSAIWPTTPSPAPLGHASQDGLPKSSLDASEDDLAAIGGVPATDEESILPEGTSKEETGSPKAERAARVAAKNALRQRKLAEQRTQHAADLRELAELRQIKDSAKENPLAAIEALGFSLDQLLTYALTQGDKSDPDPLRAEVSELKEKLTAREDREAAELAAAQAKREEEALGGFSSQVTDWIREQGAAYELVVAHDAFSDVVDLIALDFAQQTGPDSERKMMSVDRAAALVEEQLMAEAQRFIKASKVRAAVLPPPASPAPRPRDTEVSFSSRVVETPVAAMGTLPVSPGLSNRSTAAGSAGAPKAASLSPDDSLRRAASLLKFS